MIAPGLPLGGKFLLLPMESVTFEQLQCSFSILRPSYNQSKIRKIVKNRSSFN